MIARAMLPDGLSLVEPAPDHADHVVRWRNDPTTRPLFLSDQVFTREDQLRWTERRRAVPGDHTFIALWHGTPVGMVALHDLDAAAQTAEYGRILIDPAWRRRRLGHAVTGWILAHGFETIGLKTICANCLSTNRPIHLLLVGFGFRPVGVWTHESSGREVTRLEIDRAGWHRPSRQER